MALCTSLQVARQREPVEKREALLELVDNEELELVDKKEFELVDKKELELVFKMVVLLEDMKELELVDKRVVLLELVDKKELELVSKSIWKRRMRGTNSLWRGSRGHWWQHNMGGRG